MRSRVREFRYKGKLVAVLYTNGFQKVGKHAIFLSDPKSSLQIGGGVYPKNHLGEAHEHDRRKALKAHYEELLHLDRGKMRVNLYGDDRNKFASFLMQTGDTVHFISGGHSFHMLTSCKCIEIKQGPYMGQNKTFFG